VNGSDASRKPIFYLPKDCPSQVDIMLHQTHSAVLWPAFSIIIPHHIFIIRIRVLGEIALDEFSRLITSELKENVEMINIAEVYSNGVLCLQLD